LSLDIKKNIKENPTIKGYQPIRNLDNLSHLDARNST